MAIDAHFDPFGNWRSDFQAAGIMAAQFNSQATSSSNLAKRDDFMPSFFKPPPTRAEVATKMKMHFAALIASKKKSKAAKPANPKPPRKSVKKPARK